jgi:hypothetical protein
MSDDFELGDGYKRKKKIKKYQPKALEYSKYNKEVLTLFEAGHSYRSVASYLSKKVGKTISEDAVQDNYKRQRDQAYTTMYQTGLSAWQTSLARGDMTAVRFWFRNKLQEPLLSDDADKQEEQKDIVVNVNLNKDA